MTEHRWPNATGNPPTFTNLPTVSSTVASADDLKALAATVTQTEQRLRREAMNSNLALVRSIQTGADHGRLTRGLVWATLTVAVLAGALAAVALAVAR